MATPRIILLGTVISFLNCKCNKIKLAYNDKIVMKCHSGDVTGKKKSLILILATLVIVGSFGLSIKMSLQVNIKIKI